MKEKVVYVLGAGFSAPAGIPVIRNFLQHSKDLFFGDPVKYKHFLDVFRLLDVMGKAERYYHANLFNIEEVLSILEMEHTVTGAGIRTVFADLIRDTINAYTPEIPGSGQDFIRHLSFRPTDPTAMFYCRFVANLFGLAIAESNFADIARSEISTNYVVVSLNYDLLLERAAAFFGSWITFASAGSFSDTSPVLLKLHGSAAHGSAIIAPTWNKADLGDILDTWKDAYKALAEATQIRFIGYSLPPHDSYIPYLLKAAVLRAENLKKIDVLCLDDGSATVARRFADLVRFYDYRFVNGNVHAYLDQALHAAVAGPAGTRYNFTNLEMVHERFFNELAE